MMANLSIIFAMRGKSSQIWMPGTFVLMGRNSPRISDGALGFRSNMSRCEGRRQEDVDDGLMGGAGLGLGFEGEEAGERQAARGHAADLQEGAPGHRGPVGVLPPVQSTQKVQHLASCITYTSLLAQKGIEYVAGKSRTE
jgi:hypothetical protein